MEIVEDVDIEAFKNGDVVFAIFENDNLKGIVNTNEDYERKIKTHQYTPLLYVVPLSYRIAYLYGCLNREFSKKRDTPIEFKWRRIHSPEWRTWFIVHPSKDKLY